MFASQPPSLAYIYAYPIGHTQLTLSWVGFLIAGTTWVCSVLITISILTDPSLDRGCGTDVEVLFLFFFCSVLCFYAFMFGGEKRSNGVEVHVADVTIEVADWLG